MILASRGFTTVSAHINILHHNNNSQMDTYGAMFPINFQATHHGKHWETMDVVSHHFKGLGFGFWDSGLFWVHAGCFVLGAVGIVVCSCGFWVVWFSGPA